MSSKIVLEVEPRVETGKNAARRLRAQGKIPGNVYGLDTPPFMVAVDPKRIDALLRLESGVNTIFGLGLPGTGQQPEAMIKALQRDPVTERPLHVDFVRVDVNRPIHVAVPIRLVGVPDGVKNEGGILDFVHREVQVECLPANIPEHLDLDVSELHINQHVSLKELKIGAGVRLLEDLEHIVAVVSPPRAEEAPAVAATAEVVPEQPEVIKRGKEAETKEPAADGPK